MQSDIPKLLERLNKFLAACEEARGTGQQLVKAAPAEITLYNIATSTKREITSLKAIIEDLTGTYLKEANVKKK